ncbi:hypothetical protein NIES4071_53180 [Calothrix sp. NIES-4071]|nr:hypothetical protein NIES4071_53180 [Calothrix sp. NIES-4071]BAZ59626.1 hypothetical protein NIES4105_53130 [Calothrix sp. NIES-4105]
MKRIIAIGLLALPFAVLSLPKPAAALEIFLGTPRYHRHRNVIVEPVVVEPSAVVAPATVIVPAGQAEYQQQVWVQGHWEYTNTGRYWVNSHYEYH